MIVFPVSPKIAAQEVLRGEVRIDLEPIYGSYADSEYPLSPESARRRALDEAALFYSAMIYGWSFDYDIGEKARGIAEAFELTSLGAVRFGDPGLFATDAEVRDMRLYLWTDYRLTDAQKNRATSWKTGMIRRVQAMGHGPLDPPVGQPPAADEGGSTGGPEGWLGVKQKALEDAARQAVRAMLRGGERNRPKEVRGRISLTAFPRYFMDRGTWAADARFQVEVTEIIPFAAY